MKWLNEEKGFTFLEMTIVIAIIGFLMMIGLPNYKSAAEKAQGKSCEANKKLIESQMDSYYIDLNKYPVADTTTTTDVNETIKELVNEKYLKTEPKCPSNGTYQIPIPTGSGSVVVDCTKHPNITTPATK